MGFCSCTTVRTSSGFTLYCIPPEIPTKEYKNSQISNKASNTSSSCEISYDEKDFPPLGHSVAISDVKHFPPLGHSVADSDEKNFSRVGHSIATSSRLDIKRETSDHDIDFESKDASLPNNTSMNSTYSNIESSMSSNFESSIVLCTTSEGYNSTESFGDNSQIRNTYISSNMNNLNDDKQNKNVHTSPLNNSDSMNPDEENVVHDESCTSSSSKYKLQKSPVTNSYENFCSIAPFVSQNVNSNLNINPKIFVPSCVSSPVSEEPIDDDMSLKDFLGYNYDIMEEADDFYDYSNELKKKILEEIREFGSVRDELFVLCDLMENKLPLRCQKKVTARMYDIVEKHYKKVQINKLDNSNIDPFVSQNVSSNLNINPKIFVPSCVSSPVSEEPIDDHNMSLKDFLDYNYDIMEEVDLYDYSNELKKKILEEIREFGSVKGELSVLCDLMENKLSLRCQKKITARMYYIVERHYKRVQNNMFNTNTFRHTRQENQECGSSSRGRGYQDKRNAMRRQESSNRENSNREEEYAERSDFNRGNSNRGDNSNTGHLNIEEYSRGIGRGRRFPSNRRRGDSHRGSEYRNRRIKYEN